MTLKAEYEYDFLIFGVITETLQLIFLNFCLQLQDLIYISFLYTNLLSLEMAALGAWNDVIFVIQKKDC